MSNLDRERSEGLYLKFSEPLMEPHTPVIIERVNGDCTVSKFIIARDEAHELINQLCEFLRVGSPRKVGEDGATIEDGFGSAWSAKCECGARMQIVRPGSAECSRQSECPVTGSKSVRRRVAAQKRPSSVPVGEQKQEEGV